MKEELLNVAESMVQNAVKTGFDEAIAIVRRSYSAMAKVFNSQLSVLQRWVNYVVSLYLAKDKRMFIVELHPTKPEEIVGRAVEELLRYAKVVEESPFYAPIPEPKVVEPLTGVYSKTVAEHIENPSPLVELLIEASHRERIDYVAGMIELWVGDKALASSKGAGLREEFSGLQMYVRAFSEPDGSGQWSYCSTKVDEKGVENAALTAARYARGSKGRGSVEPGRYDLVLSPLVAGNLLELVARMASAFSMFMGTSVFMKNKPGDTVASDKLTIVDEPRNVDLPNATGFDDEGLPTFNKAIIENGVFKTILHNSKTASLMGMESTGNAGWVFPHPWNIVVKPGDYSLEEMIRDVKRGLLITNNWYTRLQNYVEGIFSTIGRDAIFYIENGEVEKPVERVRIADKIPNLLRNVAGLTKDLYNTMWWEVSIPSKIPYVLVRDVNVSKHLL